MRMLSEAQDSVHLLDRASKHHHYRSFTSSPTPMVRIQIFACSWQPKHLALSSLFLTMFGHHAVISHTTGTQRLMTEHKVKITNKLHGAFFTRASWSGISLPAPSPPSHKTTLTPTGYPTTSGLMNKHIVKQDTQPTPHRSTQTPRQSIEHNQTLPSR